MRPPREGAEPRHGTATFDAARLQSLARCAYTELTQVLVDQVTLTSSVTEFDDWVVWKQAGRVQEVYVPPLKKHTFIYPLDPAVPVAAWVGFRDEPVALRPGEIVVVPAGRAWYFNAQNPVCNLHVQLSPKLLKAGLPWGPESGSGVGSELNLRVDVVAADAVTAALLAAVEASFDNLPANREILRRTALTLSEYVVARQSPASSDGARAGLSASQMRRVRAYMDRQLACHITLAELADVLGLSKAYFCRCFLATQGESPMQFVMRLRMARARELVDSSSVALGEIAFQTGFADGAHFSRAFRRHWGLAPSKLRQGGFGTACRRSPA